MNTYLKNIAYIIKIVLLDEIIRQKEHKIFDIIKNILHLKSEENRKCKIPIPFTVNNY